MKGVAASLLGCQLKRSVLDRNFFGNLLLGFSKHLFDSQKLGNGLFGIYHQRLLMLVLIKVLVTVKVKVTYL